VVGGIGSVFNRAPAAILVPALLVASGRTSAHAPFRKGLESREIALNERELLFMRPPLQLPFATNGCVVRTHFLDVNDFDPASTGPPRGALPRIMDAHARLDIGGVPNVQRTVCPP
jgi:hypothetical protein